jgi:hypothetical protein
MATASLMADFYKAMEHDGMRPAAVSDGSGYGDGSIADGPDPDVETKTVERTILTGLHFKSKVSGSKFTLLALVRTHAWTCVTYTRPMKFNPPVLSNLESRGAKWTPQ